MYLVSGFQMFIPTPVPVLRMLPHRGLEQQRVLQGVWLRVGYFSGVALVV